MAENPADMLPEPIILVAANDPDKNPLLYACARCGSVHSPKIYLATKEVQHATAYEAARDCYGCRTHNDCQHCGAQVSKGWLACEPCRLAKAIEAAVEVEDNGGPYFAFDHEVIYYDLSDAADAGHEWVCPCSETYPRLDADRIFENLTEEMFEDASPDDLEGTDELTAAIKTFNDAQTSVTYWADQKRKIRVPAPATEVLAERQKSGEA